MLGPCQLGMCSTLLMMTPVVCMKVIFVLQDQIQLTWQHQGFNYTSFFKAFSEGCGINCGIRQQLTNTCLAICCCFTFNLFGSYRNCGFSEIILFSSCSYFCRQRPSVVLPDVGCQTAGVNGDVSTSSSAMKELGEQDPTLREKMRLVLWH